mgnify:FL=1
MEGDGGLPINPEISDRDHLDIGGGLERGDLFGYRQITAYQIVGKGWVETGESAETGIVGNLSEGFFFGQDMVRENGGKIGIIQN